MLRSCSELAFSPCHSSQPMKQALTEKWSACTVASAHSRLEKDDIKVTNESDKREQLDKLARLDAELRELFKMG